MDADQALTTVPERTQDRMWHDLFLPDDVAHVRSMAREAVAQHLAPVARQIAQTEESRDSFPWSAFNGLAAEGCFAVLFPAPHGAGLEHPMLATCIVTEEIAYESSSLAGVYDGQCILNARCLSFASPDVRDRVLPALIAGDSAFSFAITEPDASSDLSPTSMQTVAARAGDGFVVNGRKRWITNSVVADWVCVLCRDGEAPSSRGPGGPGPARRAPPDPGAVRPEAGGHAALAVPSGRARDPPGSGAIDVPEGGCPPGPG